MTTTTHKLASLPPGLDVYLGDSGGESNER